MRQYPVPMALAEREQLTDEELAPLADGFSRQVSGLGVGEILLDGFSDRRNVRRRFADLPAGFPVVDDLCGRRPVSGVCRLILTHRPASDPWVQTGHCHH